MHPSSSTVARAFAAALLIAIAAQPASAACTRLGFSVNDYGKDGPTKDAKGLLDKYIAKWAADHKIATYRTGTKEVKCDLFLNFIVFDEHTCRAEATVCWEGAPVTPAVKAEGAPDAKPAIPKASAVKRAAAPATPTVGDAAAPAKPVTAAPAKPAAVPVKPAAAKAAAAPVVTPIETGTLPEVAKPSAAVPAAAAPAPAVAPPAPKAALVEPAIADQALAAAQRAAAAAERAAVAAERAAAAAQAVEKANAPAAAKP